ncbi:MULTISPECIES: EF-hand domain-containing protein [unclassified Lysobacter]|uniref:HvfA family oxazolone/thioamide-modified RiPP metallophore n=1 Tax=unclassified Lysobacter TaxID=2635362 RepID=UPI001C2399E6|nr:EF-hand domain-containing protein [Lysobacter sp. MMG2]MBU8977820.1 EF-hand domain-containing protein [Lysobacter sp. MMG2]
MSRINTRHPAGMLGVALAGLVLSGSAFAVQPLSQGYMLAAAHAGAEGKCGEGKCGEGKCGEGKCGTHAKATAKAAEGKCGEGQCGDARFASADTDKDHLVSRAEFVAVVPGGEAIFATKDPNGDGFISEKEAYQNVKQAYDANGKPMPRGLFAGIKD